MLNKAINEISNLSRWILGLNIAAATLLGLALALSHPASAKELKPGESVKDVAALHAQGALKDVVVGKADAPVTIIEYSSLTCGHCASFHTQVLPDLKKNYLDTGKAKYIVREFPLDNLAVAGFMLARCKGDKYNDIVEDLYAHQEEWAFVKNPLQKLKERAKKNGYNDESFVACLRDQKLLDKIVAVRKKASEEFDVDSTPTLFVDGKILRGPSHIDQIKALMPEAKK